MWVGIGVGIGRNRFAQDSGIFAAYAARVAADGGVTEAGACVDAVTGLLLNASLLLVPSGYKANKLYSEIPTNGNGDLTWTRGSTANRTNSSGLLESMATGVPRLSYMYGSCPAVLLEPQRTNIFVYSSQLDDSNWNKQNCTITANSSTAPDGTLTADLVDDGTAVSTQHWFFQNSTLANSTTYTMSFYAKYVSRRYMSVNIFNGSTSQYVDYDIQNGSVFGSTGDVTASIINVGNGWYRVVYTRTMASTGTPNFRIAMADDTGSETYTGSNKQVLIWGLQLEAGAYPTTYIPTTSATATRVADSFSRSNIYTNGLISASGGTWYVELRNNVAYTRDASNNTVWIGDTNNGTSNSLVLRSDTPSSAIRLQIVKYIGGTQVSLFSTTTSTVKIAIKWNGTTADVFANGTKVVSATAFTTTIMEFLGASGQQVPTFIQAMALYPSPLSDTNCTTLTTL